MLLSAYLLILKVFPTTISGVNSPLQLMSNWLPSAALLLYVLSVQRPIA